MPSCWFQFWVNHSIFNGRSSIKVLIHRFLHVTGIDGLLWLNVKNGIKNYRVSTLQLLYLGKTWVSELKYNSVRFEVHNFSITRCAFSFFSNEKYLDMYSEQEISQLNAR